MTTYCVFREGQAEGGNAYWWLENVEAASASAAIKLVAKEGGRYVSVPARSFNPVDVEIKTVTTVAVQVG